MLMQSNVDPFDSQVCVRVCVCVCLRGCVRACVLGGSCLLASPCREVLDATETQAKHCAREARARGH